MGSRLKENRREAERWLLQAENDLEYARLGLGAGFFAQVCFNCQQVCEKALESIHYGTLGKRVAYGHSLVELSGEISVPSRLVEELAVLDQHYIPTRYPNGLPGTLPYEVYTKGQAQRAVAAAEQVFALARQSLEAL